MRSILFAFALAACSRTPDPKLGDKTSRAQVCTGAMDVLRKAEVAVERGDCVNIKQLNTYLMGASDALRLLAPSPAVTVDALENISREVTAAITPLSCEDAERAKATYPNLLDVFKRGRAALVATGCVDTMSPSPR